MGFRAGTCTTYNFFDITMEIQQPVKVHPFAIHDYALLKYDSVEDALLALTDLYNNVKRVNGTFSTVFSNELLGGSQKVDWLKLYKNVLKKYHV